MNATCSDINERLMATSAADIQTQRADGNLAPANTFLYQAATVLAILLLLVSF